MKVLFSGAVLLLVATLYLTSLEAGKRKRGKYNKKELLERAVNCSLLTPPRCLADPSRVRQLITSVASTHKTCAACLTECMDKIRSRRCRGGLADICNCPDEVNEQVRTCRACMGLN